MDECMERMDEYYGAMVGEDTILICTKCLHIAKGSYKKFFYRDHGDHLGELSQGEKSIAIMKGIVLTYSFFNVFKYIYNSTNEGNGKMYRGDGGLWIPDSAGS